MSKQKLIKRMTGYKATDANMKCRGFQFVLGKWAKASGDLLLCKNGFHFCEQPSGPWCYYDAVTTRVFKVEAEGVLEGNFQAGVGYKRVCRRIRLVEEVFIAGKGNTGYGNTGNFNAGNFNAGNHNAGYLNAGNLNAGYDNAGDCNAGDRNVGDFNAGNENAGNRNAGHVNAGNLNIGNRNAGNCNATSCSSGFFCQEEPNVICFDVDTGMKRSEFMTTFPCWSELADKMIDEDEIAFEDFSCLPGITPEKLESLHAKQLAARKKL